MRGYAAFIVMLHHLMIVFLHALPVEAGLLAVDLFFVMSGLVIEKSYGTALRSGDMGLLGFLRKRLIRLYPLYGLGSVLGLLTYVGHIGSEGRAINLVATTLSVLTILPQFLFGLHDAMFAYNPPAWSLSVEFYGGLILAFVAPRVGSRILAAIMGAGLLSLTYGVLHFGTLNIGPHFLDFPFGYARFAFSYPAGILIWRNRQRVPKLGRVAPIAVAIVLCFPGLPANDPLRLTWIALVFPMGVIAALQVKLGRIGLAVCENLGRVSYPLYIIHVPITHIVLSLLSKIYGIQVWSNPAAGLLAVIVSLLASAITAHWIETPLKRAFINVMDAIKY